MKTCGILLVMLLTMSSSVKGCAFPAELIGTWTGEHTENQEKDVIISSTKVDGWPVHVFQYKKWEWKCAFEDTDKNHLLLRLREDLQIFSMEVAVFRCIQWKKLDKCSYEITFLNKKEPQARDDRVWAVIKQGVQKENLGGYCYSPSLDTEVHKITKQGCTGA